MSKETGRIPKHPCADCGRPVHQVSIRCSRCAIKHIWKVRYNKGFKAKQYIKKGYAKGERHPHWKGGRYKSTLGYIFILKPEYPRANKQGYIQEHIFIWEQTHNKPVPQGWEVHHYNGIKTDNRPRNLFAKSKTQHKLIIPELQKRIQELEALLNNQHQLL